MRAPALLTRGHTLTFFLCMLCFGLSCGGNALWDTRTNKIPIFQTCCKPHICNKLLSLHKNIKIQNIDTEYTYNPLDKWMSNVKGGLVYNSLLFRLCWKWMVMFLIFFNEFGRLHGLLAHSSSIRLSFVDFNFPFHLSLFTLRDSFYLNVWTDFAYWIGKRNNNTYLVLIISKSTLQYFKYFYTTRIENCTIHFNLDLL